MAANTVTSAAAQGEETFGEEVLVQETALLVSFSGALADKQARQIGPGDLVVLEDGESREVTRVESIPWSPAPRERPVFENVEVCPWTSLIYIDSVLASPRTIFDAVLALAQRAEAMTDLGCVDVVVADPEPVASLIRSRSPEYLAKILIDLGKAARAQVDRDHPPAIRPLRSGESHRSTISTQWDRLLTLVAERGPAGPKALFLVSDGFTMPAEDLRVLAGRRPAAESAAAGRRLAKVVSDTAQTLASYGWLTVAMPGNREVTDRAESPREGFEAWRETAEGRERAGEKRTVINFFGTTRREKPTGTLDDRLYEAYLLPDLAPLRALVEATSGEVVWSRAQLDETLESIRHRRLVWFRTAEPHDGRVRRLRVKLADSLTHLDAPWWKRSSTPHLVAESRLRQLAGRARLDAGLDVSVDPLSPETLTIRVAPAALGGRESIGHVRLSIGFMDASGVRSFRHRIDYDAPPLGRAWQYTVELDPPAGTSGLVVGVEDLSLEEWGGTVVQLPTEPAGAGSGTRQGAD